MHREKLANNVKRMYGTSFPYILLFKHRIAGGGGGGFNKRRSPDIVIIKRR